jgi:hypothetical protein
MPERSSASRVRSAAPKTGAPWTPAGRSAGGPVATGGSGGKTTTACRVRHNYALPAIHRPFLAITGTATRRLASSCATPSVSRPAGSLKLNLRGRPCAVPANGCLVTLTLMRWPNPQRIASSKSFSSSSDPLPRFRRLFQVQGKFCFPLTGPYHGCPLVFPLVFPPGFPLVFPGLDFPQQ